MKTYPCGNSLASQITYPLDIPLEMFRAAEHAAKEQSLTLCEFVRSCIAVDLERVRDEQAISEQRRRDQEALKRLSKSKKITIIQEEGQP